LYERNLLDEIRKRVRTGQSYVGTSAGSVVTSPTIRTTNDMPIVQPPSFDALGLIPFQLNCHYLDPDPGSTHKGETREERIREFHEENPTAVVGLREGTCLRVDEDRATLLGGRKARIFRRSQGPFEVDPGTRIDQVVRWHFFSGPRPEHAWRCQVTPPLTAPMVSSQLSMDQRQMVGPGVGAQNGRYAAHRESYLPSVGAESCAPGETRDGNQHGGARFDLAVTTASVLRMPRASSRDGPASML
jgi:hypothetical protein